MGTVEAKAQQLVTAQVKEMAKITGNVIREHVAKKVDPLESRVAAIEQRLGMEKTARPRVRVPAITERI